VIVALCHTETRIPVQSYYPFVFQYLFIIFPLTNFIVWILRMRQS